MKLQFHDHCIHIDNCFTVATSFFNSDHYHYRHLVMHTTGMFHAPSVCAYICLSAVFFASHHDQTILVFYCYFNLRSLFS